ncbi:MAG: DNA-3-methyladenine glycosylase family protein [Dermatophilaceae bacterium]
MRWADVDLPVDVPGIRAWLLAHLIPGVDTVNHHIDGRIDLIRLVPTTAAWAEMVVRLPVPGSGAPIRVGADGASAHQAITAGRGWLGLDCDPAPAVAALAADPVLGPLVTARPHLRVPGSTDPFETAVFVVLGQQVSMAAARRFAGRLVDTYGEWHGARRAFPTATTLASADDAALRAAVGLTGARARTVVGLARAVAAGLDLTDRAARASLLTLPGVGPWTADLVAMRCARHPDVFLAGDLVVRRALGATAAEADRLAAVWRPHRSMAVIQLWTHHVLDPPGPSPTVGGRPSP